MSHMSNLGFGLKCGAATSHANYQGRSRPLDCMSTAFATRLALSKLTLANRLYAILHSEVPAKENNSGQREATCGACAMIESANAPMGMVSTLTATAWQANAKALEAHQRQLD